MKPAKPPAAPAPKPASGLCCRDCGCRELRVIYMRKAPLGRVRRRRECRHCGKRTTTYESEER
jgi:transcriptional regulator NrdR family protein